MLILPFFLRSPHRPPIAECRSFPSTRGFVLNSSSYRIFYRCTPFHENTLLLSFLSTCARSDLLFDMHLGNAFEVIVSLVHLFYYSSKIPAFLLSSPFSLFRLSVIPDRRFGRVAIYILLRAPSCRAFVCFTTCEAVCEGQ